MQDRRPRYGGDLSQPGLDDQHQYPGVDWEDSQESNPQSGDTVRFPSPETSVKTELSNTMIKASSGVSQNIFQ